MAPLGRRGVGRVGLDSGSRGCVSGVPAKYRSDEGAENFGGCFSGVPATYRSDEGAENFGGCFSGVPAKYRSTKERRTSGGASAGGVGAVVEGLTARAADRLVHGRGVDRSRSAEDGEQVDRGA